MGKFQTIWKFFFKDSKKEQGNTNHSYATQRLSRTQCTEGLQQPPNRFLPPWTLPSLQLLLL